MTHVLMPVKYDVVKTLKAVRSFSAAYSYPAKLVVIIDNDDAIADALAQPQRGEIILKNTHTKGFWNSLNVALEVLNLSEHEPIVYVGNDVTFEQNWHAYALHQFYASFGVQGLGLLTFHDGIHNGFNASHGMTTRGWLEVLNGEPKFWPEYFHYFHDSELTNRSKDLGRFVYCERSRILHAHDGTHYDSPMDKKTKDRRDREWVRTDKHVAQQALKALCSLAT